ncbi:MAG: hypothetical protein ACJ74J_03835 [Blastocatellia bacterium]
MIALIILLASVGSGSFAHHHNRGFPKTPGNSGHNHWPISGQGGLGMSSKALQWKVVGAKFIVFDPTRPIGGWRRAWRNLTKQAGLAGFRFHDLRHHAITELAEA